MRPRSQAAIGTTPVMVADMVSAHRAYHGGDYRVSIIDLRRAAPAFLAQHGWLPPPVAALGRAPCHDCRRRRRDRVPDRLHHAVQAAEGDCDVAFTDSAG